MAPNTVNDTIKTENFSSDQFEQRKIVKKEPTGWFQFQTKLKPKNIIFVVGLHLTSLYYILTFPYLQHKFLVAWSKLRLKLNFSIDRNVFNLFIKLIVGLTIHLSGLGVTAGAHRLWAHRTYKAKMPLRILLAIFYYSAGQNSIFNWVRDHRIHHKYTDTEGDPHNNTRGFWFSHVGWLMMKRTPEVRQRLKNIDMSDIINDPVVQFFDRYVKNIFNLIFL